MKRTKIISIANEKGGVGKTTTTHNLGSALAQLGRKVLVVDLDKQCNLTSLCGGAGQKSICDLIYEECMGRNTSAADVIRASENGLDYIGSSKMLDSINSQIACNPDSAYVLKNIFSSAEFEKYDYIFFDNKPAIDILTQNALNTSDGIIIPIEAGLFAFDGIDSILSKVRSINATTNPRLKVTGILYNKSEHVTEFGKAIDAATQESFGKLMFSTQIPYRKAQTERAISMNTGCVNMKNNTLAQLYMQLANEFEARVGRNY